MILGDCEITAASSRSFDWRACDVSTCKSHTDLVRSGAAEMKPGGARGVGGWRSGGGGRGGWCSGRNAGGEASAGRGQGGRQRGKRGCGRAPADVKGAAAGGGLLGEEAVEDAKHVHHAAVLPQIILRLGQEQVPPPVAAREGYLRVNRTRILPKV